MNTHTMHTWIAKLVEGWNAHDIAALLPFYAPDFEATDLGQSRTYRGIDGLKQLLDYYVTAFPDLRFEAERTIIEHNDMSILWTASGTHQGKIMNIPPTGRKITVRGVSMLTVHDGQVKRAIFIWDVAGLLRNIGLLPDL
jgi:steroid delta-isomerase-like uncharacterized protein